MNCDHNRKDSMEHDLVILGDGTEILIGWTLMVSAKGPIDDKKWPIMEFSALHTWLAKENYCRCSFSHVLCEANGVADELAREGVPNWMSW